MSRVFLHQFLEHGLCEVGFKRRDQEDLIGRCVLLNDCFQVFLEFMIFPFARYDERDARPGLQEGLLLKSLLLNELVIPHAFKGREDPLKGNEGGQDKKDNEERGKQCFNGLLEFSLERDGSAGIIIGSDEGLNENTLGVKASRVTGPNILISARRSDGFQQTFREKSVNGHCSRPISG